jgi:hypothetical protein
MVRIDLFDSANFTGTLFELPDPNSIADCVVSLGLEGISLTPPSDRIDRLLNTPTVILATVAPHERRFFLSINFRYLIARFSNRGIIFLRHSFCSSTAKCFVAWKGCRMAAFFILGLRNFRR